jgi:(p)ppGpp synthase/HD superfamily hydrolase
VAEQRRYYIRPTPDDFASDEAIEGFAARLWQAFTQLEGVHMTTQLTERYADAVAYAATAHATQPRKGTNIPYISHLLAASGSVLEAGGDEDLAIAGLLHDVVEDQGGLPRADDVRARYGDRVADIVLGCSDSTSEDAEAKAPYAERKAAHIAHLREASDDVLLVTAADKLHNARAIHTDLLIDGPDMLARFSGEPEQILAYYYSILDLLESRGVAPLLVVPLRHAVEQIAQLIPGAPESDPVESA